MALAFGLLTVVGANLARAAPSPSPSEEPAPPASRPEKPLPPGAKRELPDYSGRGAEPTTVGDVLLWIPRVVFSPLYFVSEFLVRRPLGWVVASAEEQEIPQKVVDLLTFGPENNVGIIPTGIIDFGFRPSVGVYFFYNDFLARTNKLRARVAFGGADWLLLNLADRVEPTPRERIGVRAEFSYRPDHLFHGFGPESGSRRARYKSTLAEAGFAYGADLWRSSRFESFSAVRHSSFDLDTGAFDDPTVGEEIRRGRYPTPPGAEGFSVVRSGFVATLDTRRPRDLADAPSGSDFVSPPGTGLRLQFRGEHAASLSDAPRVSPQEPRRYEWLKYGGSLGGYLDLSGEQRVLGLTVAAELTDPTEPRGAIPFTEQATLGGNRYMRGFLEGRLVDRTAALATLEYEWPVWVWLDGTLHYAVGNVYAARFANFESELLRQSFGLGLRSSGNRDHAFELLVAFGTETFADGAEVENVRLLLGATSGF
ncbi:MAG: BamA/TamA family outer membrane protein [Polyangiaceae bacterium]